MTGFAMPRIAMTRFVVIRFVVIRLVVIKLVVTRFVVIKLVVIRLVVIRLVVTRRHRIAGALTGLNRLAFSSCLALAAGRDRETLETDWPRHPARAMTCRRHNGSNGW